MNDGEARAAGQTATPAPAGTTAAGTAGTGPVRGKSRGRTWIGVTLVSLFVCILLVVVYGVTLGPEHFARAQAERVDGTTALAITRSVDTDPQSGGTGETVFATVTPASQWSARPMVAPLFGNLRVFTNPAVIFGVTPGMQLESPDGALTVTIEPLEHGTVADVFVASVDAGAVMHDEYLVSGLRVRHVDVPATDGTTEATGLLAVVSVAERANADDAAVLVVQVTRNHDAPHPLRDYRPAIAGLLETITLEE